MPNSIPYDPCGHTKIAVSDFKKSYLFYKDIFVELRYKQVLSDDDTAGWSSPQGYGVWISQAEIPDYKYKFDAPGLHHLCLKADSPEMVDQIYQFLLKKNIFIFNAPQKYPEYTDKYYAVFFADPDGIKLEVAYY
jgi:glyoxylase I family protein